MVDLIKSTLEDPLNKIFYKDPEKSKNNSMLFSNPNVS